MNVKNFIKAIPAILALAVTGNSAQAQLVNCNAFLQGKYVEVGVNINGAFGTSVAAPSGYHPRGGQTMANPCVGGCGTSSSLGFVADPAKDGWGVATGGADVYYGDYFLPGSPQEGWSVMADGVQLNGWNQNASCSGATLYSGSGAGSISGAGNIAYTDYGYKKTSTWQGNFSGLAMTQETIVDTGGGYFTMRMTLTNTTGTTKNNVYYLRTVDPDQGVNSGSSYTTNNNVDFQLPNSQNATLVSARATNHADAYLGLGSLDCRAKCFMNVSGLVPTSDLATLYAATSTAYMYSGSRTADAGISLVFNLGNLAPGASVSFAYAYLLDSTAATRGHAFAATSPSWVASGDTAAYRYSGDTAQICIDATSTITIPSPGIYTWSWYSLSGETLTTYSGPSTTVTAHTSLIRLMAVGVSSGSGCAATSDTLIVTLDPRKLTPAAPTVVGNSGPICAGTTLNLNASGAPSTASYQWFGPSSFVSFTQNPSIVSATTGNSGTYTVYALRYGCLSVTGLSTTASVLSSTPGTISNPGVVCNGTNPTLTTTLTGGSWTSSNSSVATIGSTGMLTSISAGSTTISYITSCAYATRVITIGASPVISGSSIVCSGSTTTLSGSVSGSWSSSNTSVATVNSTGVVSAVATGTSVITLTNGSCFATKTVTVGATPSISGASTICAGATTVFTSTVSGGTWSGGSGIFSIDSTGTVTGISTGSAAVTYITASGCAATQMIFVNAVPVISGSSAICSGSSTTLSGSISGSWTSSNTSVATVSTSGVVSAVATGTSVITLTNGSCFATKIVTVSATPSISGASTICSGATTTFTSSVSGGTWSGSLGISIDSTGTVTGISNGSAFVTYTTATGCTATQGIFVNATPVITSESGTAGCSGTPITLSVSGGSTAPVIISSPWSSSNTAVAVVDASGVVTSGGTAGTATITYTAGSGCFSTIVVTMSLSPAPIMGTTTLCVGASSVLTESSIGNSWTSSNPSIATIGSASGLVTAITAGSTIVTFTGTNGCTVTTPILVNAAMAAISGPSAVCVGATATFADASEGGVWSSTATGVATISSTGIVTGAVAGTTIISYTASTACYATKLVTVLAQPAAITGNTNVCVGATTALATTTTGGSWVSGDGSIATVSSTGIVTGASVGTVMISYVNAAGCSRAVSVNVGAGITAITGSTNMCVGITMPLSNATTGGVWSSSNTAVATITTSGAVTGVATGSAVITYTVSGGCYAISMITVNSTPATISGPASVCVNEVANYTNATTGGIWTGSNDAIGYVSPAGGFVIGMSAGTITLSYALESGCYATKTVTIKALPAAITGATSVCVGSTTTLSDVTPVGISWTSSNPSVAAVGSGSGIVTGVAAGEATITYTINTGCSITSGITVNNLPDAIGGTFAICQGTGTTLSIGTGVAPTPGTWSSSNTAIATIGSAGTVSAVAAGTAIITFSAGAGCNRTQVITVNALPNTITGNTTVCNGSTSTLSSTTTGGVWSSSDATIASVSGGIVTGNATGTATISYTNAASCSRTTIVTVNAGATAITGTMTLCSGGTTTLSNATTGGIWTSSNTAIATITSGGVVTGTGIGVANITYSLTAGCRSIATVTVNSAVAAITGASSVCAGGATTTLATTSTDGVWSSSNTAYASVDASGIVTGIGTGTLTISYTSVTGCYATKAITVKVTPGGSAGTLALCVGGTSSLVNATATGVSWSSSNPSVATIGTGSGVVTALSLGTTMVTYTINTGCFSTDIVTVNAGPAAISGTLSTCVGTSTNLTSATAGGSWTSANPSIAGIGTAGSAQGNSAGVTTITYSLGGACVTTASVTVNAVPNPITGTTTICQGSTGTLTSATTGGAWTSSDGTIASVTGGVVTGVSTGNATITYTVGGTCSRTATVNITAPAASITGTMFMCVGGTTTLANTSVGTWSSSNTAVATITSSGVVTGAGAGIATITYAINAGCRATATVTVNASLSPITGTTSVLVGSTTTLSNATPGGVWSSSNTSYASVDASGVVTGVAAGGHPVITYALGACYATAAVTVSAPPSPILGVRGYCLGTSGGTLTCATPGVMWSSSDVSVATIGSASGAVVPVSLGTTTISYLTTSGVYVTTVVTVSTMPAAITGNAPVCVGSVVTLSNPSTGVWNSDNNAYATVDASGNVTGVAQGVVIISYTNVGCSKIVNVTVNPLPNVITGTSSICVGSTVTLSETSTGGTWLSGNTAIATVSTGGVAAGVANGSTDISYRFTATGCARTFPVTVITPSANTGGSSLCVGNPTTLGNATTGGTWSSSNASIATVSGTTGVVTGVAAGAVNITYTINAGCRVVTNATVNAAPANIAGTATACEGATSTLTDATTGGTWAASNANATVGAATGIVTGVTAGTLTITYALTATGCYKTATYTVKAVPAPIGGSSTVCTGATTGLTLSGSGSSITSSNTSVATVNGSGIVSGLTAGNTTITYTITNGCFTTKSMTVNQTSTITGTASVALSASSSVPYTASVSGGTWVSSNTARATINASSGILSGVSSGTLTITYTTALGCPTTKGITITAARAANSNPGVIAQANGVQVYPNPSNGAFNISTESAGTVTVLSLDGKVMNSYQVEAGVTLINLPQGIAAGNYMCRFIGTDGSTANVQLTYKP